MDGRPGTPRDEPEEEEKLERAAEDAGPTTDFGTDVPHELMDAAEAELETPADETDEG